MASNQLIPSRTATRTSPTRMVRSITMVLRVPQIASLMDIMVSLRGTMRLFN
jgi:hypothetical protein